METKRAATTMTSTATLWQCADNDQVPQQQLLQTLTRTMYT